MTSTPRASRGETADAKVEQRLRALRVQAYRHLNAAIQESDEELSCEWLARGDPALGSLRRLNESEWRLLVNRHCGRRGPEPPQFPERPWGSAARRRDAWWVVIFACLGTAVATLAVFGDSTIPTIAIGALVMAGLLSFLYSIRAARDGSRADVTAPEHAFRSRPSAPTSGSLADPTREDRR